MTDLRFQNSVRHSKGSQVGISAYESLLSVESKEEKSDSSDEKFAHSIYAKSSEDAPAVE